MTDRVAILGDVHGDAERLRRMLALVRDVDQVILVGDYVNRGPCSRDVMDALVSARLELGDRMVLLKGNHEQAVLDFLDTGDFVSFARHGGMATIRSYSDGQVPADVHAHFRRSMPANHERLLRELLLSCWETPDLLVSHCGFDPDHPFDRSEEAMVRVSHPQLFSLDSEGGWPKPLVVCGHYLQRDHRPFTSNHLVCLDTGCGAGGPLTALILPERTFLQV